MSKKITKEDLTLTVMTYSPTREDLVTDYWEKAKLFVLSAIDNFTDPVVQVVRVSLSDSATISNVTQRLKDHYRKAAGSKKLSLKFIWVREVRPSDAEGYQGEHYHLAIAFDAKKRQVTSVQVCIDRLQKDGSLLSYWWSRDCPRWMPYEMQSAYPNKTHHLASPDATRDCLLHLEYLCKSATKEKEQGKRNIGYGVR